MAECILKTGEGLLSLDRKDRNHNYESIGDCVIKQVNGDQRYRQSTRSIDAKLLFHLRECAEASNGVSTPPSDMVPASLYLYRDRNMPMSKIPLPLAN